MSSLLGNEDVHEELEAKYFKQSLKLQINLTSE